MLLRETRNDCFTCGAQVPNKTRLQKDLAARWFDCPDCGGRIITGIVQKGGTTETAYVTIPDFVPEKARMLSVPAQQNWALIEIWWTTMGEYVTAIHGRPVYGSRKLYEFVEKLYELRQ